MSIFPTIPPKLSSYVTRQLYLALPPPPDDTPETIEARDLTAMAAVARLGPANTAEAFLAVQAVAAQQHASDALQSVARFRDDFQKVGQCRAQSALMMRQAATALKELRILQQDRLDRLMQRQADADAAEAQAARDAPPADADPICPSPGLASFADAWKNDVRKHQSHGMGWRFTHRYSEIRSASARGEPTAAFLAAPIPVQNGMEFALAHQG